MKYAVIQFAGKQYQVSEKDTITVDRVDVEAGKELTVNDVLLTVNDSDVVVGQPVISGAAVKLKVVSHGRGDKIRVAKFRSKSRYRRVNGHRQEQSVLEVVKIG